MRKTTVTIAVLASTAALCALGVTSATADGRPGTVEQTTGGSASADRAQQARNGTEFVGGGTWTYGVWDGQVHSVFNTARSTHRASARSSNVLVRSAWMPPTKVAYAHRPKAISGNQAFWDTRG